MRDARIAAIYEGANGIQAIDLVQRKLPLAGGATVRKEIAGMRAVVGRCRRARRGRLRRDRPRGSTRRPTRSNRRRASCARRSATTAIRRSPARIALSAPVRSRARRRVPRQGGARGAELRRERRRERNAGASRWRAFSPKNWRPPRRAWRASIASGARLRWRLTRRSWRTRHERDRRFSATGRCLRRVRPAARRRTPSPARCTKR